MRRFNRPVNDEFPTLGSLPIPEDDEITFSFASQRERDARERATAEHLIHSMSQGNEAFKAQALQRLEKFTEAREQRRAREALSPSSSSGSDTEDADSATPPLSQPEFKGTDFWELDEEEEMEEELRAVAVNDLPPVQVERSKDNRKRRRVAPREMMMRASERMDETLSHVRVKFVDSALNHMEAQVGAKRSADVILPSHYTNAQRQALKNQSETDKKMQYIQNILDNLDNFFPADKPRTTVQRMCHYWYTQTLFKWVFGRQWDVVKGRVLKRYKLDRVWPWVQVLMPRREGKTWSVASFLAAVLLFVPGITISIFSPTSQQSNMMKDEIYRMMAHYESNTGQPATRRIVRYNTKNIMVADRPLPPQCSIKSSAADAMVLESATSRLLLCNSNTDGE